MTFAPAVKRQAKLKVALSGPSGSGKTLSALLMAKGMGKKIAVIDTENGSASLYSDKIEFETAEISPPFTIDKYLKAINDAVSGGFDVLVIDSLSHAWSGAGGLLEQKEALDARGKGNSYTNWASITKQHEAFKEAIVQAPIHVIATMRSKQEYILQDMNGKQVPRKVGMAPVQREGMEYEFTLAMDLAMNHAVEISKDRTSLFDGKVFVPTVETGKQLIEWLNGCKVADRPAPVEAAPPAEESGMKYTPAEKEKFLQLPKGVLAAMKLKGLKIQGGVEYCRLHKWNAEVMGKDLGVIPSEIQPDEDIPADGGKPPATEDVEETVEISERDAAMLDFQDEIKKAQPHQFGFLAKQIQASSVLSADDRERLLAKLDERKKSVAAVAS